MLGRCIVCGDKVRRGGRPHRSAAYPLCPKHHDAVVRIVKERTNAAARRERFLLQKKFRNEFPEIPITDAEAEPEAVEFITTGTTGLGPISIESLPRFPAPDGTMHTNVFIEIDQLDVSVRTANVCQQARLRYLGDLAIRTPEEISRLRNAGKKTAIEVASLLRPYGLQLGMQITDWFEQRDLAEARGSFGSAS